MYSFHHFISTSSKVKRLIVYSHLRLKRCELFRTFFRPGNHKNSLLNISVHAKSCPSRKCECARLVEYNLLLPAATKLGQGNIFTSVCLSTGGRGVCLSACWDIHPPGEDPKGEQTPPRSRPPQQTLPQSRPTRADTLGSRHPPGKQTPAYGQ